MQIKPTSKKILLTFYLIVSAFIGYSTTIDSLLQLLPHTSSDTTKVQLLIDLAYNYHSQDPQKTIEYGTNAFHLAGQIKDSLGIANALRVVGIGYNIQGKTTDALNYLQKAKKIAKQINNLKLTSKLTNDLGLIYRYQGYYNKAIEHHKLALKNAEIRNDSVDIAICTINLGKDLRHFDQDEEAMVWLRKAEASSKQIKDESILLIALSEIGVIHYKQQQFDTALVYLNNSLAYCEKLNDQRFIAKNLNHIGNVYNAQNNHSLALDYFEKAYKVAEKIPSPNEMVNSLQKIAGIQKAKKEYNKAIEVSRKSLEMASLSNYICSVRESSEILSQCYEAIQDYPNAFFYYKKFKAANDSLTHQAKNREIETLTLNFQLAQKDKENQLLITQQTQNEIIIRQRTYMWVTTMIVLILVCFLLLLQHRSVQKEKEHSESLEERVNQRTTELNQVNDQLVESNQELERFAHIVSHDLKEPLRNITGFSTLLEKRLDKKLDKESKEYMQFIQTNTAQLHTLIEDVLAFSKLSKTGVEFESVDLNQVMAQIIHLLQLNISEKNAIIQYPNLPVIQTNKAQIFIVLKNLIENGIKYNEHHNPQIDISITILSNQIQINVKDNGIGIDAAYHQQIFQMFKRLDARNPQKGSGLGLSISKKILNRLGGDLKVVSTFGQGSTFIILLPNIKNATLTPNSSLKPKVLPFHKS